LSEHACFFSVARQLTALNDALAVDARGRL
jgi:hypothetical protein